jgi:hypothetical protein
MRNNNAVYTILPFLSSHMVCRKLRTFLRGDFFSPSTDHLLIVFTLCIAVAHRVFPRISGPVSPSPTACAGPLTHSLSLNHLVPVPKVPAGGLLPRPRQLHHFASQVERYRRPYGAGHASLPVALRKCHIVAEAKFEGSFCFGYDMFAKEWRLLSHRTLDHLLLTREEPVQRP